MGLLALVNNQGFNTPVGYAEPGGVATVTILAGDILDVNGNLDISGGTLTLPVGYLATLDAADLGSGAATVGQVLTADGAGNSSWAAVPGASESLEDAYVFGNTINVKAADGAVTIQNNTNADTTNTLTVGRAPSGATAGVGISLSMGANTTGVGFSETASGSGDAAVFNNIGTGKAISIQDNGTPVIEVAASGAAAVTPTSGTNLTLTTAGAGVVDINSAAGVTVDSATLTATTTGVMDLDASGVMSLNTTGANAINIGNDATTGTISIGTGAAARTVTVGNTTGASATDIKSGTNGVNIADAVSSIDLSGAGVLTEAGLVSADLTPSGTLTLQGGGLSKFGDDTGVWSFDGVGALSTSGITTADVQTSGAITIDSSGGSIGVGTDANAQAINLGTGAAARTITMGNITGATALVLNSGTGNVDINATGAGGVTVDAGATGLVSIQGNANSDFSVAGAGVDLSLLAVGGSVAISASEAIATAFNVTASAGGIEMDSALTTDIEVAAGQTLKLGADTVAQTVNLGTGAAAKTVAIGSTNTTSATDIYSGSNGLTLNDSVSNLDLTAGALTEVGLASVNLTPSGAMTLQGGGVSKFGDDTGYFNYDGAGALTTAGITTADLDASGAITIGGTSATAVNLGRTGKETLVNGNLTVTQNLTVNGTTTTVHSEEVNMADSTLFLNDGNTVSATGEPGGFVVNFKATPVNTNTVATGVFTPGNAGANAKVTVAASVFSAGDLINIKGSTYNDGLFEVKIDAAGVLTIQSVPGLTGPNQSFVQNQFVTETNTAVTITGANVSVMRCDASGDMQMGKGNTTTGWTWAAVGSTTGTTLQVAYNNSGSPATITTAGGKNVQLAGTESLDSNIPVSIDKANTASLLTVGNGANNELVVSSTTGAEALTIGGAALGVNTEINTKDNNANGFVVQTPEGNDYINVNTTNAGPTVTLCNGADNAALTQAGSGQVTLNGNVNAVSGVDVTGADLTVGGKTTIAQATGSIETTAGADLTMKQAGGATVLDIDGATGDLNLRESADFSMFKAGGAAAFSVDGATGNTIAKGTVTVGANGEIRVNEFGVQVLCTAVAVTGVTANLPAKFTGTYIVSNAVGCTAENDLTVLVTTQTVGPGLPVWCTCPGSLAIVKYNGVAAAAVGMLVATDPAVNGVVPYDEMVTVGKKLQKIGWITKVVGDGNAHIMFQPSTDNTKL